MCTSSKPEASISCAAADEKGKLNRLLVLGCEQQLRRGNRRNLYGAPPFTVKYNGGGGGGGDEVLMEMRRAQGVCVCCDEKWASAL